LADVRVAAKGVNVDDVRAKAGNGEAALAQLPSVAAARFLGLPARLLLLTLLFVMLAEILIFVPSVANFRYNWLLDRLTAAHLASLAAEAVPGGAIPPMLEADLLRTAQVTTVAIRRGGQRRIVLAPKTSVPIDMTYDVRVMPRPWPDAVRNRLSMITDAVSVFVRPAGRVVRVIGQPRAAPAEASGPTSPLDFGTDDFVEIVIGETALKRAMVAFGLNIVGLSIIISAISAALVYLALNRLLVSPMMRLTRNMVRFGENPEDAGRIIMPSGRGDEIGTAEHELAKMQGELVGLLRQKSRLAQLGLAVSKINHDLRNILASTQLMSDRLAQSSALASDPVVQKFQPKLIASLDRAIKLCNDTLRFGRADEAAPKRQRFTLAPLARDVGEGLALPRPGLDWMLHIPEDLQVNADPEHMFRILNNLVRNAIQALEPLVQAALDAADATGDADSRITIKAGLDEGDGVVITVSDNGPGVPPHARGKLFQAFQATSTKGGSGLGLAIAAELVAAHGGRLVLLDTDGGAAFRFNLPAAPA
jgi:signal transduction histidine kinase